MIDKIPHDHAGQKSRHCRVCGEFKSPEDFPLMKSKRSYGGYQAYTLCLDCERQRKAVSHLKRAYGLSWEDYCTMVEDQDNKCYLCGAPPTDVYEKLVVDHCHKTGEIRKLLCRGCNVFLSKIEACPDYFKKVITYLNLERN